MTRRSVVIVLHWSVVMLLLAMVKGGTSNTYVLGVFAGIVVVWEAITLTKGLLGRPGPKLSPAVRRAYPWMHRLLHILLSLTAVAIVGRLFGSPIPYLDAWTMLLVTLGAGTAHGVFHFWRHTALYDNALRLILPKFIHSIL
jgi:cytochrome b561